MTSPFWKKKSFDEMTGSEWESICDGCARCCLAKLIDEDTGKLYYTSVACRHLNLSTCRCTFYEKRKELEPECLDLTPESLTQWDWLPKTCAYRLLAEGKELPKWHPLVSGDSESIHTSGISVKYKAISEKQVDPENLEAYILIDTEI